MNGVINSGLRSRRRVVKTGKPCDAINISTERVIRKGHVITDQWSWLKWAVVFRVEETLVYEMACDSPPTDTNIFGQGSRYAETETTGAWWTFENERDAERFIMNNQ